MFKKIAIVLGLFIGLIVLSIFSSIALDWFQRDDRIAAILNIDSPPNSISSINCESHFTTDVITACFFEIDPNEFQQLLIGYNFDKKDRNTSSLTISPLLDEKEFQVAYVFSAEPEEFEHGGYVKIYSNSVYSKVIIDYYIE